MLLNTVQVKSKIGKDMSEEIPGNGMELSQRIMSCGYEPEATSIVEGVFWFLLFKRKQEGTHKLGELLSVDRNVAEEYFAAEEEAAAMAEYQMQQTGKEQKKEEWRGRKAWDGF